MRVAAYQFDVRDGDVDANLAAVERGVELAARAGAALVVLPEMWPTSFTAQVDPDLLARSERALDRALELSRLCGLTICGSAYGPLDGADKPTNRLHVLDRGRLAGTYDKVHLFSPTAEPESFRPGSAPPPTVETSAARLSGAICYDLRFPELFRVPFRAGADLLVLPAQWPDARAAHWEVLAVARAVECQCFVVACNRTGTARIGRRRLELGFPGSSLVAGPDARVHARGSAEEGLVSAEIDLEDARRLRARVPIEKDARRELYGGWVSP